MRFHTTDAIRKQGNIASRLSFLVTKSALGNSLTQPEQGDPRRGAQTSAKVGDTDSDYISNTGICAIRWHLLSTHALWWSLWAATSLHWSQRLMKMEGRPTVKSWSVFSSWAQQAWLIPWASVPLRLGPELSGSYTCTLLFFPLLIARRHALFEVRIPLCPWMSSTPANGCRGTNNSKSEDRRHLGDLIEELV